MELRASSRMLSCPVLPRPTCDFLKFLQRSHPLEKQNFKFQKRQKELTRKKKTEEKRQRKLDKNVVVKPAENQVGQTENEEVK